jgi:hypothetical protein
VVSLDASGLNATAAGALTLTAAGLVTINCATAVVNSGVLTVNSGLATFAGAVQCTALITNAVVSPLYTPGIGNLI